MEGLRVYDTVKKTGKIFQIGSQYCADAKFHEAAKWIREGKLGPLVWAQASYCRNNRNNDEWDFPVDDGANENTLDWVRWQGRAKKYPWNPTGPHRFSSWHYNSGLLGNLLSHRFIPFMIASATPEFPRRVVCTGTRKVSENREITDTTHVLAEMPSGLTYCVVGSTVNEQGLPDIIRGRKATLYFAASQNKVELRPERIFSEEIDPQDFNDPAPVGSFDALQADFFNCIRTGNTPLGNIELAVRANTILCLAEMSERMSTTLLFDEKTRKITNGEGKTLAPLDYDTGPPAPTPILSANR
jgi:predicted dehydrogenase